MSEQMIRFSEVELRVPHKLNTAHGIEVFMKVPAKDGKNALIFYEGPHGEQFYKTAFLQAEQIVFKPVVLENCYYRIFSVNRITHKIEYDFWRDCHNSITLDEIKADVKLLNDGCPEKFFWFELRFII